MPTIECENCEQEFTTPWKAAKLCPPCRCLRDVSFMAMDFKRACLDCGKDFYPVRSSYKLCYECTDLQAGRRKEYTCNVCRKHNRIAAGMNSTCLGCVQSSADNRRRYVKTLRERVEKALQTEG